MNVGSSMASVRRVLLHALVATLALGSVRAHTFQYDEGLVATESSLSCTCATCIARESGHSYELDA